VLLTGTQLSTLQTAVAAVPLILLKRQWQYALEYLGVAVFFGILVLSGVFIEIWLMPYLIASVIANILLISQHELPVSRASKFTRSRTIVSNRFVSWILYNGNYHLEHHLFPKVTSRYLPKVHAILRETYEVESSMISIGFLSFVREYLVQSWRRLRVEPTNDKQKIDSDANNA